MLRENEEYDRFLSNLARARPALAPRIDRITQAVRLLSGDLLRDAEGVLATDETATGTTFPGGGFVAGR